MNRVELEKQYWNFNAQDKDVDIKYISDADTGLCLQDLGEMNGEVLEIGCGVGRLLKPHYEGIDISMNMLEIASEKHDASKLTITDGRNIPFEDKSFDTVYCYLVFQHLPKDAVRKYINESYRVLKNGGTFIFQWIEGTERETFSNHYSKDEINEMIKKFSGKVHTQSKAYEYWTITRCIK